MEYKKFDRFLAMIQPEDKGISSIRTTNTTQDIPGAQPDAYGRLRHIHGKDYNKIDDIIGARPGFLDKPPLIRKNDYKLITKDITEEHK